MNTEYVLNPDGTPYRETRGGARANSGPKPKGYVKPQAAQDFDSAKLRKERSLADMHELNYKVKSGQYVERAAVREAAATLLASLAQSLRGIPDNLERKFNLPPDVAEDIERVINAALGDVAEGLCMFTDDGSPA